ncbi:MAG: aldo/keto reductase, partial [Spirochaetota bacterium]
MDLKSTVKLNNGVEIPWVGLGVFQSEPGPETQQAVEWALELGYRHIDTAAFYENEESVGRGLKASGIARDDVFITTKVWNNNQGYDEALAAFDQSLKNLGMDTVDLYLVHWPIAEKRLQTWKALEKIYAEGRARAIGVSNFLVHHLEELAEHSGIVPAVNQVEFHPFLLQKELLDYDHEHGIRHEAWSPLTRAKLWDNPVIDEIAAAHGKSRAQVLLRWDLHHGVVTIPKSVHKERIAENAQIFDFELSDEEVARLDGLDRGERIGPDPDEM